LGIPVLKFFGILVDMRHQKIIDELKKLNPWPVEYLPDVEDYIDDVFSTKEAKENRLLLELFEKTVEKLETFPPDPDFFTEPEIWFHDIHVMVTTTHHHKKITLMAHYRFYDHKCVIVELKIK